MSQLKTQQMDLFPTLTLQANFLYVGFQALDNSNIKDSLLLAVLGTGLHQYQIVTFAILRNKFLFLL